MNVLMMGLPFCTADVPVRLYRSAAGHDVRLLKCAGSPHPPEPGDYVFDPEETAEQVIARIRREWAPELLVCWTPELLPPPREIEHCPIRTAAVVSDWNIYFPQLEYNLSRYDVAVSDKGGSEHLRPYAVRLRYFGPIYSHRSTVHRRIPGMERDIDVLFAGNLNAAAHFERCRLLEQVARLSDRHTVLFTEGLTQEEYARLLNRAKIVFNRSLRGEMNLRCFEAVACGSLLFIERENLEVPEWLEDGKETVYYGEENLIALLEQYLRDNSARERIAENGRRRIESMAGERRLDTLIDAIAGEPDGARRFHELPPDTQAFADLMQYASSMVVGQRAVSTARLPRWRRLFPDRPEFPVASGCAALGAMNRQKPAEKVRIARAALHWFRRAASICPDAAVFWMNLSFLAKKTGAMDPQHSFLERAIDARSADFGGCLLGEFGDRYYVSWRNALAYGHADIAMLHAAAHAQLAAHHLAHGALDRAVDDARRSIELAPQFALPHRVRARAEMAAGRPRDAADILEKSSRYTAFDAEHRMALIEAYQKAGKTREALDAAAESYRIFLRRAAPQIADQFLECARNIPEQGRNPTTAS